MSDHKTNIDERLNLLKVTLAELTSGNTKGAVYESVSEGGVFFLADRSEVLTRVLRDLSETRRQQSHNQAPTRADEV